MYKLARRASISVILAASNPQAHLMFGGLTLAQIGAKYDLFDEDVEWYDGTNANTGELIKSVLITVKGLVYQIPISRGLDDVTMDDYNKLPNCMVRVTNKSVKVLDANGNSVQKKDANGVIELTTEPYMSLGKPGGIVLDPNNRYGMFEDAPAIPEDATHA